MLSRKALCPAKGEIWDLVVFFVIFQINFLVLFCKTLHTVFSCKINMISIGRKFYANAKVHNWNRCYSLQQCMLTMLCGAEIVTELLESRQRYKQKENYQVSLLLSKTFVIAAEKPASMLRPDT